MSDDKQENSPERQRSTTLPYARQRGYDVVGEYVDLGMRGWDQNRPDFQRLLLDALAGKFEVIVVDDLSRLSRDDEWEFIDVVASPLRKAGVVVDVVSKGEQSWNSVIDLITLAVNQHRSSQESVELSRRVATGLGTKARRGELFLGRFPFAYTRHRGNDGRYGELTPGKPEDVDRLRWMFDAYANQDWSLRRIGRALDAQGVPTPQGGVRWEPSSVRVILRNRLYVGDYVFGETTEARYHRVNGPKPDHKAMQGKKPRRVKTPPEEHIIIPDHHEALVGRDVFERVQVLLVKNRKRTTPHLLRNFMLSRLLVCGKCGGTMVGATERHTGKDVKVYRCGTNLKGGVAACGSIRITERLALDLILGGLEQRYLSEENLAAVIAEARALQAEEDSPQMREALDKQAKALEAKIRKAKGNLALLDSEFIPEVQAQIRGWEREAKAVQEELARFGRAARVTDLEEFISHLRDMVRRLRNEQDDPGLVRAYLAEVVERVVVHTRPEQKRKRVWHHLDCLSIQVKGGCEVVMSASA
jgi:DNA invertase Pin-like site-specific DNA recombinase